MEIAGAYDGAVMSGDSIEAGDMASTTNVLRGERCTTRGTGWISAIDGTNAAVRHYRHGAIVPPNVSGPPDGYRAVHWSGSGYIRLARDRSDNHDRECDVDIRSACDSLARRTVTQLSKVNRSIADSIDESGKTIVGTV
jgi:hypothetical protein